MTWGSSPLTRGKRTDQSHFHDGCGLIPTHAGKTIVTTSRGSDARAHPRSRGENVIWPWLMASRKGSSPLTRGKLRRIQCLRRGRGFIPAHAGKTNPSPGAVSRRTAHPHSCGENCPASWSIEVPPGSSPLTQGKRLETQHVARARGLIPTHAGKTACRTARLCCGRAHPHSCGENTS